MMPVLVELCVEGVENAHVAATVGADRIELCADLPRDGTTPSVGVVSEACAGSRVPIHVLIRPRPGDFVYTPAEIRSMIQDIEAAARAGAAGVALGALTPSNRIDLDVTQCLIEAATGLSVTFHRAFDLVPDPTEALELLTSLGVDRLLTSGRPGRARDHLDLLAKLQHQTAGRLRIIAAGGITAADIPDLVAAGIGEIHSASAVIGPDGRVDPARVRHLLTVARRPSAPL
ncbi:MAG: copper homeostasis protein CutC [Isosphaeraceae bacterium]|jgi:copper homeostasis protein|nr:MAG: copper homeostasis protein CutC [Isosphaeraceae bacterium]